MRKVVVLSITVLMLFAAVGGVMAVTWGVPDGNGHPWVGTLIFQRPDGYYSCTGTLMSSRVMLTAGHCVEENNQENIKTWVSFDPVPDFSTRPNYPSLGAFLDANWLAVSDVQAHPQYTDFSTFPNTFDVGVVILRQRHSIGQYGQLPALGALDQLASGRRRNTTYTVVGYGDQGILRPFEQADYERYVGTVTLQELNSTYNGDQHSAKFTNNPGEGGGGSGGTCFGDSGGPIFVGNTRTVVAVVSWGKTPCIGVDYQFRVDTRVAQDFLRQYIS